MPKLIAILFMFIFSFQVLPVKELGALLAKGTFNEEIPAHGMDIKCKASCVHYWHYEQHVSCKDISGQKRLVFVQHKEDVPYSFVGDIFSPPPNTV